MNLKEIVLEVMKRIEEAQYGIERRACVNIVMNIRLKKSIIFFRI
jgi:hypothetical protein